MGRVHGELNSAHMAGMEGMDMEKMMSMMGGMGGGAGGEGGEGGGMDMAALQQMMAGMGGGGGGGMGGMGGMGGGDPRQQEAQMAQQERAAKNAGEVNEDGYTWEQTSGGGDSEITISFKMEKAVTKKDIKVTFTSSTVKVVVAGVELLAGKTFATHHVDDATWCIADKGMELQVLLCPAMDDKWHRVMDAVPVKKEAPVVVEEEEEGVRGSSTHVDLKDLKDSGSGDLTAEEFAALRAKTKTAAECSKNMTEQQKAEYGCKTGVAASAVREDSDDSDEEGADFQMGAEGQGALLADY